MLRPFLPLLALLCAGLSGCTLHEPSPAKGSPPTIVLREDPSRLLPHLSHRKLIFNGRVFRNPRGADAVEIPELHLWLFVTSEASGRRNVIHVVPGGDLSRHFEIRTDIDFGDGLGRDKTEHGACFVDKIEGNRIYFRYRMKIDPLGDGVIPPDTLYLLDTGHRTFARIK